MRVDLYNLGGGERTLSLGGFDSFVEEVLGGIKYANHYFLVLCGFYTAKLELGLYSTHLIGGLQDIYTAVKMAITVNYRTYHNE